MSASYIAVTGYMIYHRTTQKVPVRLLVAADWRHEMPITCEVAGHRTSHQIERISPPEGKAARIITLDNGNKVFIAASDMLPIFERSKWSVQVDKAERAPLSYLIAISVVITGLIGLCGYYFFPKIADSTSDLIPDAVIKEVSEATLFQLDSFFLGESELPEERQEAVQMHYDRLAKRAGLADVPLYFRQSSLFGPNALALPGGPVIVIDELVDIAPSDEGIAGVLAHELAHIALAHNRKTIARNSLFGLIAIMMTGTPDIAASSDVIKGLVFSGYSREFEAEADILARQWMVQEGYDEAAFDEMLIALYNHDCSDDNCTKETEAASSGWFDSHPSLSERLSLQGN